MAYRIDALFYARDSALGMPCPARKQSHTIAQVPTASLLNADSLLVPLRQVHPTTPTFVRTNWGWKNDLHESPPSTKTQSFAETFCIPKVTITCHDNELYIETPQPKVCNVIMMDDAPFGTPCSTPTTIDHCAEQFWEMEDVQDISDPI